MPRMMPDLTTSTNSVENWRAAWMRLLPGERPEYLANLKPAEVERFLCDWPVYVHDHQLPPALTQNGLPWRTWLILGGRGAGKTRAGAEWVRGLALGRDG